MLLGCRARVLAGAGGLYDGRRVRGRLHAQPDLRGSLQRTDRPRRGGAGCSAILWDTEEHRQAAQASRDAYNERLRAQGYPEITTEIAKAGPFYYAEDYHQQYLQKNPWGYCGLGGTGVSCPIGLGASAAAQHTGTAVAND